MRSIQLPKKNPPGEMIDIGGLRLHALVRGQGVPTVLLEPALGGFAQQYSHIQEAVSAFTRVLAYDRAGQGWSDASLQPRTPEHLAYEWRALLKQLDFQPPYVLVGHSFGGMLARVYAGLHPAWLAGIVLVDSTHEDEYAPFPDVDQSVRQMTGMVNFMKLAGRLGLGKPLAKLSLGPMARTLSKEDLAAFVAVTSQPKHQETMLAEFAEHRCYFGPNTQVPPSLGDIPLMVVTAEKSISGKAKVAGTLTGDDMNALHQRLQKELVRLSTHGEQVIVPGATHLSLLFQPEHAARVVEAIRRFV